MYEGKYFEPKLMAQLHKRKNDVEELLMKMKEIKKERNIYC